MQLQRISAKLYIANPDDVDLPKVTPVFHRWISEKTVPGLLIDVADYKHVPEGPGVMLVGHEGDYSVDFSEGRPGFRYERKRDRRGEVRQQIHQAIQLAVLGAQAFADQPQPHPAVEFATGELLIAIADRLHAPNTAAKFAELRHEVEAVVGEIYGGVVENIEQAHRDVRDPLAFRVRVDKAVELATLADRVGQPVAAG